MEVMRLPHKSKHMALMMCAQREERHRSGMPDADRWATVNCILTFRCLRATAQHGSGLCGASTLVFGRSAE